MFPQSPFLWHSLTVIFILCLVINGIIYLQSFKMHVNIAGLKRFNTQMDANLNEAIRISTSHQASKQNFKSSAKVSTSSHRNVVNPHSYSYLLNEPNACHDDTDLVIIVCTSMKNFAEREALRNTWGAVGKNPRSNVTVLFLVGRGNLSAAQEKLKNESGYYRDIIQEDFIDSYRNLSIKSQALLKWVSTHCTSAKYVLKADDDMYVNVPNLLTVLKKQKDEKFILGVTFNGAQPVQSPKSKWFTPLKDFSEKYYPRYTSGTSYSMSMKAVPDLYRASLEIKLFWLEDIYITGLCARRAGIKRLNDYGFHYVKMAATGCAHLKSVTGHRNSIREIYKIYKELQNPHLKCDNSKNKS